MAGQQVCASPSDNKNHENSGSTSDDAFHPLPLRPPQRGTMRMALGPHNYHPPTTDGRLIRALPEGLLWQMLLCVRLQDIVRLSKVSERVARAIKNRDFQRILAFELLRTSRTFDEFAGVPTSASAANNGSGSRTTTPRRHRRQCAVFQRWSCNWWCYWNQAGVDVHVNRLSKSKLPHLYVYRPMPKVTSCGIAMPGHADWQAIMQKYPISFDFSSSSAFGNGARDAPSSSSSSASCSQTIGRESSAFPADQNAVSTAIVGPGGSDAVPDFTEATAGSGFPDTANTIITSSASSVDGDPEYEVSEVHQDPPANKDDQAAHGAARGVQRKDVPGEERRPEKMELKSGHLSMEGIRDVEHRNERAAALTCAADGASGKGGMRHVLSEPCLVKDAKEGDNGELDFPYNAIADVMSPMDQLRGQLQQKFIAGLLEATAWVLRFHDVYAKHDLQVADFPMVPFLYNRHFDVVPPGGRAGESSGSSSSSAASCSSTPESVEEVMTSGLGNGRLAVPSQALWEAKFGGHVQGAHAETSGSIGEKKFRESKISSEDRMASSSSSSSYRSADMFSELMTKSGDQAPNSAGMDSWPTTRKTIRKERKVTKATEPTAMEVMRAFRGHPRLVTAAFCTDPVGQYSAVPPLLREFFVNCPTDTPFVLVGGGHLNLCPVFCFSQLPGGWVAGLMSGKYY